MEEPVLPPSDFKPPKRAWHFSFKRLLSLFRRDEAILEEGMPRFTLYSTELIIFLLLSYTGLTLYGLSHPSALKGVPVVGGALARAVTSLEGKPSSNTNSSGGTTATSGGSGGSSGNTGGGGSGGTGGGGGSTATNPFGASIDPHWTIDQRITAASALGLRYIRTEDAYLKSWDSTKVCNDCQAFTDAGFKVMFVARNTTKPPDIRPPDASTYPTDINDYKRIIGEILDKYKIAVLVIENEAGYTGHFTGTPEQYETMLEAGCTVAHARNIPCMSDGMVSSSVKLFTIYYYECVENDKAKADAYRQKVPGLPDPASCTYGRTQQYVDAYKNAAPDYVNIHWYSDPGADPVDDADAFEETVNVFETATGRPTVSNETATKDHNAAVTTERMKKIKKFGTPFWMWYCTGTYALTSQDGGLKPEGIAFHDFITNNY